MNIFNIRKTFEMKRAKGWPEVYFCIDLHGTIIPSGKDTNDTTDEKAMYPYAQEVLQYLSSRKDIILILWTSTPQPRLNQAWGWFDKMGINFKYVNENPHAKDTARSSFKEKFYFNVLLDDRAGFSPEDGDWLLIAKELENATGDSIIKWNNQSKSHLELAYANMIKNINLP